MEPALFLIFAGIGAMVALPIVSLALVRTVNAEHREAQRRSATEKLVIVMGEELKRCQHRGRVPGEISTQATLTVRDRWREAGYDVSIEKASRMVSIAHAALCQFPAGQSDPGYVDGDRSPPAKMVCQPNGDRCMFPDCQCAVVPEPAPPRKPDADNE